MTLIQAYAPISPHGSKEQRQKNEDEIDSFYDELQSAVDSIPNRDELILLGDFNAKIGGLNSFYPENIGSHTNSARGYNDRGIRLANFCKVNRLFINNSGFKHRRKYTWTSPGERYRNTVDYIMCRTKSTRKIQDCHTITHPDISDHRIVRCQINFKFIRARKQDKPTPRFDTKKLQTVAISKQFAKNVSAALITTPNTKSSTVQDIADAIETALINTSNEMLKKQRAQQMPAWMSENTLHEIHTKHETRAAFGHTSIEYRLKRNLVKKPTKLDKE